MGKPSHQIALPLESAVTLYQALQSLTEHLNSEIEAAIAKLLSEECNPGLVVSHAKTRDRCEHVAAKLNQLIEVHRADQQDGNQQKCFAIGGAFPN
ncbi:hypothetical protein [uncultured Microbulbifer sp.]|uniref:hypothetical protein n=1 Tax=uncultured Microbulbifer sp. TaxID=348147 RepID=UPI00261431B8|nr:hypothetical protein [uncultured Microbulbifer sp.]